jgi:hypothetical protein
MCWRALQQRRIFFDNKLDYCFRNLKKKHDCKNNNGFGSSTRRVSVRIRHVHILKKKPASARNRKRVL